MTLNFDKVLRIKISDNKDTTFWCLLDIIFKWHKIYQNVHQVILPFKNQKLANAVKKQLSEQCNKLGHSIQPVSKVSKICENLKMHELEMPLIKSNNV